MDYWVSIVIAEINQNYENTISRLITSQNTFMAIKFFKTSFLKRAGVDLGEPMKDQAAAGVVL